MNCETVLFDWYDKFSPNLPFAFDPVTNTDDVSMNLMTCIEVVSMILTHYDYLNIVEIF